MGGYKFDTARVLSLTGVSIAISLTVYMPAYLCQLSRIRLGTCPISLTKVTLRTVYLHTYRLVRQAF